jgi:hypothetical protein
VELHFIIFAIGRFLRLGSYHCLGASCQRNLLNSFPFSFAKLRNGGPSSLKTVFGNLLLRDPSGWELTDNATLQAH